MWKNQQMVVKTIFNLKRLDLKEAIGIPIKRQNCCHTGRMTVYIASATTMQTSDEGPFFPWKPGNGPQPFSRKTQNVWPRRAGDCRMIMGPKAQTALKSRQKRGIDEAEGGKRGKGHFTEKLPRDVASERPPRSVSIPLFNTNRVAHSTGLLQIVKDPACHC